MKNTGNINIDGVSDVVFRKSRRARKLSLFLEPSKVLKVTIPYWTSYKEAKRIITSNTEWVNKYLEKMKKLEEEHSLCEKNDVSDIKRSKMMIKERLKELSVLYGYSYNKVTVRSQKTRWGSCSGKNNINLNVKISRLPDKLRDYILIHELVHTEVKNHKEEFWKKIEEIIPDARICDSQLRKYQLNLL